MNNFIAVLISVLLAGAMFGVLFGWAACKGDEERDLKFCWIKFSKYVIFCTVALVPAMAFLLIWTFIKKKDT